MRARRRTPPLLRLTLLIVTAYLLLCAMAGAVLGDAALRPPRRGMDDVALARVREMTMRVGARMESVTMPAADGAQLRAWLFTPPPQAGADAIAAIGDARQRRAVIVLHGVGDTRTGVRGPVDLLLSAGYIVLTPDARAHGESGGALATYGVLERDDVRRWAAWLRGRGVGGCIHGVGLSMGAAHLLQALASSKPPSSAPPSSAPPSSAPPSSATASSAPAASARAVSANVVTADAMSAARADGSVDAAGIDTPFCSAVAESSFATFREVAFDRIGQRVGAGPWLGRTLLRPIIEFGLIATNLRYHVDLAGASPLAALRSARTPVLLIHGDADDNISLRHARLLAATDPAHVTLWVVPGARHTSAQATDPAGYRERLLQFLSSHEPPYDFRARVVFPSGSVPLTAQCRSGAGFARAAGRPLARLARETAARRAAADARPGK